ALWTRVRHLTKVRQNLVLKGRVPKAPAKIRILRSTKAGTCRLTKLRQDLLLKGLALVAKVRTRKGINKILTYNYPGQ
ncbi:MAG: hypothetical protein ACM3MD_08390, partial [Betaproteobacteria bacterium]